MRICVLVPAYNESKRIGRLIPKIRMLKEITEIIVVDDGSADSTYEEAKKAGVIVLRHEKNKGKGAALRTGFSYLKNKDYDAVITMDGDGQHKYSEIPQFIEEYKKNNVDIVVGSRMPACQPARQGSPTTKTSAGKSGGQKCENLPATERQAGMPLIRYLTNRFTSSVTSRLGGCRVTDSQSGFRLISTEVLRNIKLSTSNFEIESEVIVKAARKGFKIKEIPISTVYLEDSTKKSKIHPVVDTLRFFRFVLRNLS